MLKEQLPSQIGNTYILMTLDDDTKTSLDSRTQKVIGLMENEALESVILTPEQEKITWKLRDHIILALTQVTECEALDIEVPINKFAETIKFTKTLETKHGISVVNFGHVGDGNIHTILLKEDLADEIWEEKTCQVS